MAAAVSFRQSGDADAAWIADLRAEVMRPDLERLDIFDPLWVRERFLRGFVPHNTRLIVVDGEAVGSVAVRSEPGEHWIEHFYIATAHQGRGIGGGVLRRVLGERADSRPFRLNVLRGSAARTLYERHGFRFEHADEIDVFMVAP
ncbi:GNAT family N-acetyltransferase [Conyzicola nivalis]|uniref:N-acetyltransferase n=1 Tax=Conyzicola nivalis TaxID=1477021 RepID=A0A916SDS9_9MICO|nr:GNAT family N-acetyltransferase [Conyzicola nivalis]GGA91803.1 N-acetyltransferase [Conyzicola nivalis]